MYEYKRKLQEDLNMKIAVLAFLLSLSALALVSNNARDHVEYYLLPAILFHSVQRLGLKEMQRLKLHSRKKMVTLKNMNWMQEMQKLKLHSRKKMNLKNMI